MLRCVQVIKSHIYSGLKRILELDAIRMIVLVTTE